MPWGPGGGAGAGAVDQTARNSAATASTAAATAQTGADASAKRASNLSDLANAGTARTNLDVPATAAILLKADNLSGLASASAARTALGLGTAAVVNTGTGAGNVPVLDGSSRMPAVDGSQMTNLPGGATTLAATQTAHGFAVGDVLRRGSGSYAKAEADSAANAEVIGIVTAVAGANNFTFQPVGPVITGLSGLTDAETYFLDPATPGVITVTEPSTDGEISKPILIAISTTSGVLLGMRGMVVGGGADALADVWDIDTEFGAGTPGDPWTGEGGWTPGPNGTYTIRADHVEITGTDDERYIGRALPAGVDFLAGEWEFRVKLRVNPDIQAPFIALHNTSGEMGLFARLIAVAGTRAQLVYVNSSEAEPAPGATLGLLLAQDSAVTFTFRRRLDGVDTALNGGWIECWANYNWGGNIPFVSLFTASALFAGDDGDDRVRLGAILAGQVSSVLQRVYHAAIRDGLNPRPPCAETFVAGGW